MPVIFIPTSAGAANADGLTFLQLYDDLLDIELGTTDQTQLFLTTLRKNAVNEAMKAFVRLTKCTKRYGEISITDGLQEYDLESNLTDYLRRMGPPSVKIVAGSTTRYLQGEFDLPRRDVEQLDSDEPGWRAATPGTPHCWYLKDDGGGVIVGLHPAPDVAASETWTLLVPYLATPAVMVDDADYPFVINGDALRRLNPFHKALVHHAAGALEPLRKNYSAYDRQMKIFTGYVANYLGDRSEDQSNQIQLVRSYYGETNPRVLDPRRYP